MKYALFALLILFACKNNHPAATKETASSTVAAADTQTRVKTETKTETQTQPSSGDTLYRLVVYFYSIGSGAEYPLINEYIDSLGMFSQNIGKKIDYKRVSWGREGETDVVMQLKELTPEQQKDFIQMTRRVLAKGQWVNIYENYPYHKRGK